MNTRSLIVFSGVDGAGKSTQIDMLVRSLQESGQRPTVLWTRLGYTPGINALRWVARALLGRHLPPPGPGAQRDRVLGQTWVRRWWLRLAMCDLCLRWGIWLRVCRWMGQTVICDRYWLDSLLDLQLHFPQEAASRGILWKLVGCCCPHPDVAFVLLIPLDEYRVRSPQKREPFPLTDEDFVRRHQGYAEYVDDSAWIVLDGQLPQQVLAEQIANHTRPAKSDSPRYRKNVRQYT